MKQYSELPVELRLHVASYLSSIDLASLARVSKSHIPIAREKLYQAPEIGPRDEGHRVLCFLRTMFARPELIHEVRSLSISFLRGTVPTRPSNSTEDAETLVQRSPYTQMAELDASQYRATRNELMERLCKLIDYPENRERTAFLRLKYWLTSAFYGGLIVVLPNLEELSLRSYAAPNLGDTWPMSYYSKNYFSLVTEGKAAREICRRMKLKRINCLAGPFEHYTDVQPCLESLHVDADACFRIGDIYPSAEQPTLTNLDLGFHMDKIIEAHNQRRIAQLWELRPMLPGLQRIKLMIVDMHTLKLPYRSSDFFDTVFDALDPCAHTLETLEILPSASIHDRTFPNDVFCAMLSLSRFTRLSKLVIPFRQGFDDLDAILQPTLRELTLLHPGPVQACDLQHIVNHCIAHRNLRRFDLYCALGDDVVLEDGAWSAFKEHGISVYVWAIVGNRLLKGMTAA